ncbi:MAG: hypothetical protein AABZ74_03520 [Cyanobacteriota bacterium]
MKIKKIISLSLLFTTIALNSVIAKDLKPQKNIVFETKDKNTIDLYKNVEKIFEDVQKTRNLFAKKPVKIGIKTKNQVKDFLSKTIKTDYPDKMVKKDYLLLLKLGLIKEGLNLKEILLNSYAQQIAGFYDEKTKSLYVINEKSNLGQLESSIVISHELVHALQDQNFHINKVVNKYELDSDKVLAKMALIEGEATLASMQYVMGNMGLKTSFMPNFGDLMKKNLKSNTPTEMKDIPGFLSEQMFFPYIEGTRFCEYVYKKTNNWDDFNKVYKRLPESTEQIIHPEKYIKNEKPIKVNVKKWFLNDWRWNLLDYDTLGEFAINNWLLEYNDQKTSEKASSGWGGDKYAFFSKNDKENIFVYKSVWDTDKDAVEFFDVIKDTIKLRYENNLNIEKDNKNEFLGRSKDGYIYISKKNKNVNLADGFPKDFQKKVMKYLGE